MKSVNSMIIVLFAFMLIAVTSALAEIEEIPSGNKQALWASQENLHCHEFVANSQSGADSIKVWVACQSLDGNWFSLSGLASDGRIASTLEYRRDGSWVNLSVNNWGVRGKLNAEYDSGIVILDAVSDKFGGAQASAGAQLALYTLGCFDSSNDSRIESLYWSSTNASSEGPPINSIMAFNHDSAVNAVAILLQSLLDEIRSDETLSMISLPASLVFFSEFGSVDPAALSFAVLHDVLDAEGQTQGMMSCVLLALGAAGAIISAINSDPNLAVVCSGSCGGALACLVTLAGGGTAGVACGSAVGVCLYCAGVGTYHNVANCFRHFVQQY